MGSQNNTGKKGLAIVWFRDDLRIAANRALCAAASHESVLCLALRSDNDSRARGGASSWWRHKSLEALSSRLEKLGSPLILMSGTAEDVIPDLARRTGASAIYWNRRYDPAVTDRDATLKARLKEDGLIAESFGGQLLHEPTKVRTGSGSFYKVYTPFWRSLDDSLEGLAFPDAPERLAAPSDLPASERLDDWGLLPTKPDWAGGLRDTWTPGEDGAHARLSDFLKNRFAGYAERRDLPAIDATSGLSPHLAHGEITPAQILAALDACPDAGSQEDRTVFRKEIVWREFSWHLLVNEPGLPRDNHNARFDAFPWEASDDAFSRWTEGQTGYPIVDAGMRQLWQTGWMHNRVRMIVASFLTKHLLIDWRRGEEWFWDTLVDADPASNAASWQWVAGSGADAAPYFRIFNPVLQGEKFDPEGAYIRRFVPELKDMPDKFIHRPWEAPPNVRSKAGVKLGTTYPEPMVDHRKARDRALSAYQTIKDAA